MQGGRRVTVDPLLAGELLGLALPLLRARAWPRRSLCRVCCLSAVHPGGGCLASPLTSLMSLARGARLDPSPQWLPWEPPRVLSRQQAG